MASVRNLNERDAVGKFGDEPFRILRRCDYILGPLHNQHWYRATSPPLLQRRSRITGSLRPCNFKVPTAFPCRGYVIARREEYPANRSEPILGRERGLPEACGKFFDLRRPRHHSSGRQKDELLDQAGVIRRQCSCYAVAKIMANDGGRTTNYGFDRCSNIGC